MELVARNPDYRKQVKTSFERQGYMRFLGASLTDLAPGYCEIQVPFREELSQQHGYFHGGVVGSLADNAGGFAGASLMSAEQTVLTVEYKVNLYAPADGDILIARGRVAKSGRTLTITHTDLFVMKAGKEHPCATSLQTLMLLDLASKAEKQAEPL